MVAPMPHNVAKTTDKRNLTTNDLRSVAIGLATAVAIVMLASAMASDSGSASAGVLEDSSRKEFHFHYKWPIGQYSGKLRAYNDRYDGCHGHYSYWMWYIIR